MSSMLYSLLLTTVLLSATPFQDTHNRFQLTLPEGWQYTPMPGDMHGALFRAQSDEMLAFAFVRVWDVSVQSDANAQLASLTQQLKNVVQNQPDFCVLKEDASTLAGLPAQRLRYIVEIPDDQQKPKSHTKLLKIAEQRYLLHNGKAYVVHVESRAESFSGFQNQFEQLFQSFRIGNK